ncbi:hypothetical protein FHG87_009539, partial [Trinorchestia longiramus]
EPNNGVHLPSHFRSQIQQLYQQLNFPGEKKFSQSSSSKKKFESLKTKLDPSYEEVTTIFSVNVKPLITTFVPLTEYS